MCLVGSSSSSSSNSISLPSSPTSSSLFLPPSPTSTFFSSSSPLPYFPLPALFAQRYRYPRLHNPPQPQPKPEPPDYSTSSSQDARRLLKSALEAARRCRSCCSRRGGTDGPETPARRLEALLVSWRLTRENPWVPSLPFMTKNSSSRTSLLVGRPTRPESARTSPTSSEYCSNSLRAIVNGA